MAMAAMRQGARRIGAVAALTGAGVAAAGFASPSWACACGALFADEAIEVAEESVVVRVGESTQTLVLSLGVESVSAEAALVLPTPAPAEVDLTDAEVFRDLAVLSRPEVDYTRDWWPRRWFDFQGEVVGGENGSAVEVLSEARLGAFEVATLAADDPTALADWLDGHGYALGSEIERELKPYVEEAWYYVAVKLAGEEDEPLHGDLEPIRVEFASEEPVYPMRLSAAADHGQSVRVYLLAEHRMDRVDDGAAAVPAEVAFAGRVEPGAVDSPHTADLIGQEGAFLTTLDHDITDPSVIDSDFRFAPAADDEEERRVHTVATPYYIAGIAGGPFVVAASALAVLAVGTLAGVLWRRRTRAGGEGGVSR